MNAFNVPRPIFIHQTIVGIAPIPVRHPNLVPVPNMQWRQPFNHMAPYSFPPPIPPKQQLQLQPIYKAPQYKENHQSMYGSMPSPSVGNNFRKPLKEINSTQTSIEANKVSNAIFMNGVLYNKAFLPSETEKPPKDSYKLLINDSDEEFDSWQDIQPLHGIRFYNPTYGPEGNIPEPIPDPKGTTFKPKPKSRPWFGKQSVPYCKPPESMAAGVPHFQKPYIDLAIHQLTEDGYGKKIHDKAIETLYQYHLLEIEPENKIEQLNENLNDVKVDLETVTVIPNVQVTSEFPPLVTSQVLPQVLPQVTSEVSSEITAEVSSEVTAKVKSQVPNQRRQQGRNRFRGFTQTFGIVAPAKRSNNTPNTAAKNVLSLFEKKYVLKKYLTIEKPAEENNNDEN